MSYATPDDLLAWYGAKELSEMATPDDLIMVPAALLRLTLEGGDRESYSEEARKAADAAQIRITTTLEEAGFLMDGYLGHRFALPLAAETVLVSPLPRICGAITRYLLQDDGPQLEVEQRYERCLEWLQSLAEGRVILGDGGLSPSVSGVGLADFERRDRLFDEQTLSGFVHPLNGL